MEIVEQTLLFDFYGELLTKHQKVIYQDFVFHNLTLSEIAEAQGISRQGIHDLIKRCNNTLSGYEEKLHLIEKFNNTKELVSSIHELIRQYKEAKDDTLILEIEKISNHILEEL